MRETESGSRRQRAGDVELVIGGVAPSLSQRSGRGSGRYAELSGDGAVGDERTGATAFGLVIYR